MPNPRRSERVWRRIHRAANAHVEAVRRQALKAILAMQRVSVSALVSAIEKNDQADVLRLLLPGLAVGDRVLRLTLPTLLLKTLVDGANAAIDKRRGVLVIAAAPTLPTLAEALLAFNQTNPAAVSWARYYSAQRVTQLTEDARKALRDVIGHAFSAHMPPAAMARHIRSQVGLTKRMVEQVERRRAALVKKGVKDEIVIKRTKRLSDQLIRRRAMVIARTETIAAGNAGQRILWQQAMSAGILARNAKREWITTPGERTCETCVAMDGQTVGISEPFTGPNGERVMEPPLHPQCRCAVGLSPTTPVKKFTVPKVPPVLPTPTSTPTTTPTVTPTVQRKTVRDWLDGGLIELEGAPTATRTETIRLLNEEVGRLCETFPKLVDTHLRTVRVTSSRYVTLHAGGSSNAVGVCYSSGSTIVVASRPASTEMYHLGRGYWTVTGDDPRGTFRHELGHMVQGAGKWNATRGPWLSTDARIEWRRIWDSMSRMERKAISQYAATDPHEFFAECFCVYTARYYDEIRNLPPVIDAFMRKHIGDAVVKTVTP